MFPTPIVPRKGESARLAMSHSLEVLDDHSRAHNDVQNQNSSFFQPELSWDCCWFDTVARFWRDCSHPSPRIVESHLFFHKIIVRISVPWDGPPFGDQCWLSVERHTCLDSVRLVRRPQEVKNRFLHPSRQFCNTVFLTNLKEGTAKNRLAYKIENPYQIPI